MDASDEGSAANDRRYAMLDPRDVPGGENLKVTLERALPFWQDEIAPALKDNKTVLVAAHGNSLRALANTSKVSLMKTSWILKFQQVNHLFMN